jgi:hypothetical protein
MLGDFNVEGSGARFLHTHLLFGARFFYIAFAAQRQDRESEFSHLCK